MGLNFHCGHDHMMNVRTVQSEQGQRKPSMYLWSTHVTQQECKLQRQKGQWLPGDRDGWGVGRKLGVVDALIVLGVVTVSQALCFSQIGLCTYIHIGSLLCVRKTQWIVARQVPPSMGFSRQEYQSGLPFPSPGDLPDTGIEPGSPAQQADALPVEPPGKIARAFDNSGFKFGEEMEHCFPKWLYHFLLATVIFEGLFPHAHSCLLFSII